MCARPTADRGLLRLNRRDDNYTSHANQAAEPSVKTCHERATASRASRAMRGAFGAPGRRRALAAQAGIASKLTLAGVPASVD
jgi:hypothetical protein